MKKIRTSSLLLIFSLSIYFFSCVPQQKAVAVKKQLSQQDSLLQDYDQQLTKLDDRRKTKQEENELDDTASARIHKFIDKTNAEINQLHKENTVLIGDIKVSQSDWDRLRKNLSTCLNATKSIHDKILFLSDLINRNTVIKFDQDLLFDPGKYTVAPRIAASIGKFFEPVVNEIDLFTKKYPNFPLSLVITAKGYADATVISENSYLYKELKADLEFSSVTLSRENLNKELSNRRAKTIITLFQTYTKNKEGIVFVYKGKGEEFPDPKISDYKVDDSRRRVVLLFWSVFPDY